MNRVGDHPVGITARTMTNIILLEDGREVREEVAEFLRGQGHEVREAGSKREFRTLQAEQPCEIAILDRRLPDGDGMNLIAEGHAAAWRCGFILVTARDVFRDRIKGYDVGADHYRAPGPGPGGRGADGNQPPAPPRARPDPSGVPRSRRAPCRHVSPGPLPRGRPPG